MPITHRKWKMDGMLIYILYVMRPRLTALNNLCV